MFIHAISFQSQLGQISKHKSPAVFAYLETANWCVVNDSAENYSRGQTRIVRSETRNRRTQHFVQCGWNQFLLLRRRDIIFHLGHSGLHSISIIAGAHYVCVTMENYYGSLCKGSKGHFLFGTWPAQCICFLPSQPPAVWSLHVRAAGWEPVALLAKKRAPSERLEEYSRRQPHTSTDESRLQLQNKWGGWVLQLWSCARRGLQILILIKFGIFKYIWDVGCNFGVVFSCWVNWSTINVKIIKQKMFGINN